ncbi:MAG: hypothetical protein ACT4R6_13675 [Gemmatimonadaceae bacterium]
MAAAGTAGVIVGDAWRSGSAIAPFSEAGAALLPPGAASMVLLAIAGLLIHGLLFVLWGTCFSLVATSLRGGKVFLAAVAATGFLWLLARTVFPRALGAVSLQWMSGAHTLLYLATIAIALSLGTRIARYA